MLNSWQITDSSGELMGMFDLNSKQEQVRPVQHSLGPCAGCERLPLHTGCSLHTGCCRWCFIPHIPDFVSQKQSIQFLRIRARIWVFTVNFRCLLPQSPPLRPCNTLSPRSVQMMILYLSYQWDFLRRFRRNGRKCKFLLVYIKFGSGMRLLFFS